MTLNSPVAKKATNTENEMKKFHNSRMQIPLNITLTHKFKKMMPYHVFCSSSQWGILALLEILQRPHYEDHLVAVNIHCMLLRKYDCPLLADNKNPQNTCNQQYICTGLHHVPAYIVLLRISTGSSINLVLVLSSFSALFQTKLTLLDYVTYVHKALWVNGINPLWSMVYVSVLMLMSGKWHNHTSQAQSA